MRGRVLLIIGVLATLAFLATAVLGYRLTEGATDPGVPNHLLIGIASVVMMLFSHSWIVIYLAATGGAVREAVRDHGADPAFDAACRALRRRAIPLAAGATVLGFATFLLGAGVIPKLVPAWIHHALFYATVLVQGLTLWIEGRALGENEKLLTDLDGRLTPGVQPVPHAG
jgi:hypothetical protein